MLTDALGVDVEVQRDLGAERLGEILECDGRADRVAPGPGAPRPCLDHRKSKMNALRKRPSSPASNTLSTSTRPNALSQRKRPTPLSAARELVFGIGRVEAIDILVREPDPVVPDDDPLDAVNDVQLE